MFTRLSRIAHTLAALHLRQLLMLGWRRGLQPYLERGKPPEQVPVYPAEIQFCFLNHVRMFPKGTFTWLPEDAQRLWVYNLHYFDYLDNPAYSLDQQLALITHWITANPKGYGPGWEPYPLSLRLVNWCRWWARNVDLEASTQEQALWAAIGASIREQAIWLSRHLETHILANHYFENLKALAFVAASFSQRVGCLSLARIEKKLLDELKEQFLDDGGHYERSPSYHCLLLNDLLDLIELDQGHPAVFSEELSLELRDTTISALQALRAMELPGDAYPLFNDSAFDSAPRPSILYQRALELGLAWRQEAFTSQIRLASFGVFGWRDQRAGVMAIKCGAVGPHYQPGHTHCDLLSFEWYLGDKPVVVDTGVLEYQPGPMRYYLRSTTAHNTVAVEDAEQSEIWGEFRVARRARVLAANLSTTPDGIEFLGEIEGFHASGRPVHHQRRLGYRQRDGYTEIYVDDLISGPGKRELSSRLLFHPSIDLSHDANGVWHIFCNEQFIAMLDVGTLDCEVVDAPYCPEFGIKLGAKQLVMHKQNRLPTKISCVFRLAN